MVERDIHKEWGVLAGTLKSIQDTLGESFSTPLYKLRRIRTLVERDCVQEILENV